MKKTDNKTLIAALRILARDIESGDGIANAAITEAADRLEELTQPNVVVLPALPEGCNAVRVETLTKGDWFLQKLNAAAWEQWQHGTPTYDTYIRAVKEEQDNES